MKYRVWDIRSKKFDAGFWVYQAGGVDHDSKFCEEVVVQLQTGVKDKYKEDVYEGDIIQTYYGAMKSSYPLVVRYFAPFARFVLHRDMEEIKYINDFNKSSFDTIVGWDKTSFEVIGNIFENPKLIKK